MTTVPPDYEEVIEQLILMNSSVENIEKYTILIFLILSLGIGIFIGRCIAK